MGKSLRCDPKLFQKDLSGKVVIVTGCTSGTGICTAQQLVKQKATVIMASRKAAEGEKIAQEVGGVFMLLDLASLQSVRDFAKAFLEKFSRLDILVNNAGIMMPPLSQTQDGFELQMGTNHFGHFLLTELLKETLEKSAPSRVVILASCAAAPCSPKIGTNCEIDFSDLHWKSRKYHAGEAYAQSKLANVLHAMEIPKRYNGVTAYAVHPGWVQTKLFRHQLPGCCFACLGCCCVNCTGDMIKVWDGSQTSLHCILSEPEDLQNGAFYSQFGIYQDKQSKKGGWPMNLPNPLANKEVSARLWDESAKAVGLALESDTAQATIVQAPGQKDMPPAIVKATE